MDDPPAAPVSPVRPNPAGVEPPGTLTLEVPGDLAAIERVVDHAVEHCAPARLDRRRLLFNFRVGLTEAISNAILYGNSGDPGKRVRLELRAVPGEVRVRVSDEGDGFDPGTIPDPRLPENLTLPDGRGVFLMRELMDEVRFNRAGNAVTLILRDRSGGRSAARVLPEPVIATLEDFHAQMGLEVRAWQLTAGKRVPVFPRVEADSARAADTAADSLTDSLTDSVTDSDRTSPSETIGEKTIPVTDSPADFLTDSLTDSLEDSSADPLTDSPVDSRADPLADSPADSSREAGAGAAPERRPFRIRLGVGLAIEVAVAGHAADSPVARTLAAAVERSASLAREAGLSRAALEAALEANRHIREDMARERRSREMEFAHDLQLKLLPPIPRVPRVDAAARVAPARSVGGDFYQVIQLSGGRVGVMIGDVSGHGFPAALIMALVMSAAAIYAEQGAAPAKVLEYVDRAIGDELESTEMYLSLCYCVLSPGFPDIAYSNAGHPHAFVVDAGGGQRRLGATDPPMGIATAPYGQSAVRWTPGEDLLLLFTDGLSDTLAHTRRGSGEELVLKTVADHRRASPAEILDRLFELCGRASPSIPSDDRTAVVLRTR